MLSMYLRRDNKRDEVRRLGAGCCCCLHRVDKFCTLWSQEYAKEWTRVSGSNGRIPVSVSGKS